MGMKRGRFAMGAERESERKRAMQKRKRQRAAKALRAQFKEEPELFVEAVQWTKERKDRKKGKEKDGKTKKKNGKGSENKKGSSKKKKAKKGKFEGAQGGNVGVDKFNVKNLKDSSGVKKTKGGKVIVPAHIKQRKKRG